MDSLKEFFSSKKNLVNLAFLVILVLGLPIGLKLARDQQLLRSRASVEPIVFSGSCVTQRNGQTVLTCPEVTLQFTSTLGPPATASGTLDTCDPGEKDLEKIKASWTPKDAALAKCKKDKKKVQFECITPSKSKSKKIEVPCDFQSGPVATPSATPTPTPTPGTTCSLDEKDENIIKSTWTNVKETKCKKGEKKVTYECKVGNKTKKRGVKETCTTTQIFDVSLINSVKAQGDSCDPNDADACKDTGPYCDNKKTYKGVGGYCDPSDSNANDKGCVYSYEEQSGDPLKCGGATSTTFDKRVCGSDSLAKDECENEDPTHKYHVYKQNEDGAIICQDEGVSSDCGGGTDFSKKTCKYSQGDKCYEGNCLKTNIDCDFNVNCGFVNGKSSGKEVTCGSGGTAPKCTDHQSPSITAACLKCIKEKDAPFIPSIRSTNPDAFNSCSETQLVNFACNSNLSNGCAKQFKELCATECSSSSRTPSPTRKPGSTSTNRDRDRDNGSGDRSGGSKTGGGGGKNKPSPTPQPPAGTVSLKFAEDPTALTIAPPVPYDTEPKLVPYTFNPNPGTKTIFVIFTDKNGKTDQRTASIQLVAPDPVITSVKCELSSFGQGISIGITGEKLGSETGTVAIRDMGVDNLAKVTDWQDNSISATVDFAEELDVEGSSIDLVIKRKDGVFSEATCSVGESTTLALGAKLFCRAPSSNSQAGVELGIAENTLGVKPVTQTVTIDKNGIIQGLDLRFSEDKQYQISILAPRSVRRNSKVFSPTDGTIQLLFQNNKEGGVNSNKLPVGDIFPLEGGDGRIDSQDARELFREWNSIKKGTSQLLGDFNLDGKVNVIDWACMRYDYGALEDTPLTTLSAENAKLE